MRIINRIAALCDEMTAWRRDLHAHPEVAFEEYRTARARYNFNDEILAIGARYWARLVERELPRSRP